MSRRTPIERLSIGVRRETPACRRRLVPLSTLRVDPFVIPRPGRGRRGTGWAVIGVDLVASAEATLAAFAREADARDFAAALPLLLGSRPTDAGLAFVADFFAARRAKRSRPASPAHKPADAAAAQAAANRHLLPSYKPKGGAA